MSLPIRVGVLLTVLIAVYSGRRYLDVTGVAVVLPPAGLSEFPLELAGWYGEEAEIEERIIDATGAADVANRRYRSPVGQEAHVHLALFDDYNAGIAHWPTRCFTEVGFLLIDEVSVTLPSPTHGAVPASLVTLERDGATLFLIYWYQFGDQFVLSRTEAWRAWIALRGAESGPPMVKAMLTFAADDRHASPDPLLSLAEPIAAYTEALVQSVE